MKPVIQIYLGHNKTYNEFIKKTAKELQENFGACVSILEDRCEPKITNSNGQRLASGYDEMAGFLAGYACMAQAVKELV